MLYKVLESVMGRYKMEVNVLVLVRHRRTWRMVYREKDEGIYVLTHPHNSKDIHFKSLLDLIVVELQGWYNIVPTSVVDENIELATSEFLDLVCQLPYTFGLVDLKTEGFDAFRFQI